jgi:hypothetical protein
MKMNKTIQDAYRIVLNDMMNSGCGLLVGEYDARHSDISYISGVSTVMEWIAYRVSEETGKDFSILFTKNFIKSIDRSK